MADTDQSDGVAYSSDDFEEASEAEESLQPRTTNAKQPGSKHTPSRQTGSSEAADRSTVQATAAAEADKAQRAVGGRPPRLGGSNQSPGSSGKLISSSPNQGGCEKPLDFGIDSNGAQERSRPNIQGEAIELAGTLGSRRPVRAKVSVGERPGQADHRSDSIPRPGTAESGGRHASAGSGAAAQREGKPIWLQSSGASPEGRKGSVADFTETKPRSASRDIGLGRSNSRSADPFAPATAAATDALTLRAGTADGGDDRKVKRLQQEVQRLSQRLKESELYSAQDDGLPTFTLEEIELGSQLGQGGFSSVHHAVWHCTPVSVKKIFDPVITDELRGEFENEVRMLRRLRHPNIVTLMAVCRVPPALSILTELMEGGSLFDLLHGPPKNKAPQAPDCEPAVLLLIMCQSAVALAYMHAMCVVHRDVKSQNVLLSCGKQPVVKFCDFGLARLKSELCTGSMQWAGTAAYMAPELFAKKRYSEAVDIFAYGVMLWEALSMEIPHANMDPADIAHRVQHKDVAGLSIAHGWPKPLKALIRACLAVNADTRPAMQTIVSEVRAVAGID